MKEEAEEKISGEVEGREIEGKRPELTPERLEELKKRGHELVDSLTTKSAVFIFVLSEEERDGKKGTGVAGMVTADSSDAALLVHQLTQQFGPGIILGGLL